MANPFVGGGKVVYTPGKVVTTLDIADKQTEDKIRDIVLNRDLSAAQLLDNDRLLDALDNAIDDQMKDMALPGGLAARKLCGSETINWDCYKKAKEMLRIAPMIAYGYDPVQAIFTDAPTKRKGPVLLNCRDFNDSFFDSVLPDGSPATGDQAGTSSDKKEKQTFAEIQAAAEANQKSWAMKVLFWDLVWGKPEMREPYLAQSKGNGKPLGVETVANGQLPDIIYEERPWEVKQMMWKSFLSSEPLTNTTNNAKAENDPTILVPETDMNLSTAAVWEDPWGPLAGKDPAIKNRGLPAIKQGFLLSILVGLIGLIPQIVGAFFKFRSKLSQKMSIFRKIPLVGGAIYKVVMFLIACILLGPILINNACVEGAIFLALLPRGHRIDEGELPTDPAVPSKPNPPISGLDDMKINSTPGGFLPLDCLKAAQDIVTTVNAQAAA